MPLHDNARLAVDVTVPPGDTLVGFYPQQLVRFDRIQMSVCPGLSLVRGGQYVPLDGRTHTIQSWERTLCLGSFIALHVKNENEAPAQLRCTLLGITVDGPPEVTAQPVFGFFVPEFHRPTGALGESKSEPGDLTLDDGSDDP